MDNEKAQELIDKYGTLLCLDVPEGSSIGIDNKVWTSGPMFKGVKMLPPGVHMFHCTSSNEYGDSVSISSSFIWIDEQKKKNNNQFNDGNGNGNGNGQIFIKRWNKEDEDFYPDQSISEQEKIAYSTAVRNYEFDKNLAPYPFDGSQIQWTLLTCHITKSLLSRILPISNIINGDSCSYDQQKNNPTSRKEKKILDELDTKLKEFNDNRGGTNNTTSTTTNSTTSSSTKSSNWGVPYFSKIPKNPKNVNSVEEITKWNIDKSQCLKLIIEKYYKNTEMDILGEIEFSFVLFIFGMTWSGFQQWKELVTLFLSCDEIVNSKPELFIEFFKILKNQLQEAPSDMFNSELSNKIFIKPLLKQFIESFFNPTSCNIEEMSPVMMQLFKSVIDLKNYTQHKFKWNLNLFNQIDPSSINNIKSGIKKNINNSKNDQDDDGDDIDEDDEDDQVFKNNKYQQKLNNQENNNNEEDDDYDEDDEYKPVLVLDTDMDYL